MLEVQPEKLDHLRQTAIQGMLTSAPWMDLLEHVSSEQDALLVLAANDLLAGDDFPARKVEAESNLKLAAHYATFLKVAKELTLDTFGTLTVKSTRKE